MSPWSRAAAVGIAGLIGGMRLTTRRQFIALCTGGLAVAGLGVLAACQAAPPTPGQGPTSASSGSSASAAPRRGGTLTWALWDKIDDIDPATPTGASALEVINNIVDPLITMDADQKFYPSLATKWTVEDDARKFTFTLRDDVKFHDGVDRCAGPAHGRGQHERAVPGVPAPDLAPVLRHPVAEVPRLAQAW